MFSAYCPRHAAEVLYSASSIRGIRNTPHGIVLTIECYDGERFEVLSGRAARASLALAG